MKSTENLEKEIKKLKAEIERWKKITTQILDGEFDDQTAMVEIDKYRKSETALDIWFSKQDVPQE